jgi:hypothetical protein
MNRYCGSSTQSCGRSFFASSYEPAGGLGFILGRGPQVTVGVERRGRAGVPERTLDGDDIAADRGGSAAAENWRKGADVAARSIALTVVASHTCRAG